MPPHRQAVYRCLQLMNDIEYIKILNAEEKKKYISFLKNRYNKELQNNKTYIIKNRKLLLDSYEKYENEIIKTYKNELTEFKAKINLWNKKECICGKKLRFISSYGFWGCPNYRNESVKHLTFSENQTEIFNERIGNIKVRLSHNWSTEILKNSGLDKHIKAKELLLFYNSEGLEDLREKYGYKNSLKSISSFIYANRDSKQEEKAIKEFLSNYFDNISYQLYIKFKKHNETEKIRIIDLIVSDDNSVFLIEIKRHNIYIDKDQLLLYRQLLEEIMRLNQDKRTLKSLFIVNEFYESQFNENKCVLFDELKMKTNKNEIIRLFNRMNYK